LFVLVLEERYLQSTVVNKRREEQDGKPAELEPRPAAPHFSKRGIRPNGVNNNVSEPNASSSVERKAMKGINVTT
jgi:hypothetical protein